MIDERVQELLGFKEVLKKVSSFLKGGSSFSLLNNLSFSLTEESLKQEHFNFISPLFYYLKKGNTLSLASWDSLEFFFLDLFDKGLFLEEKDYLSIGSFLRESMKVRSSLTSSEQELGQDLYFWGLDLPDLSYLRDRIFYLIDDSGEIRESSVPEMKQLRYSLSDTRRSLMKMAQSFLRKDPSLFQEEEITERDGRVVLPLKSNFKGRVQGLIHSTSSSGGTIFIEPFSLVEMNNEKRGLEEAYRQIRFKILRELADEIRKEKIFLSFLYEKMSLFDTWQARATYGIFIEGNYPQVKGRDLIIYEARHPLLDKPIPLTLPLPTDKHALIITGPNAGGKTVVLKTVGLLALMHQVGIPLPLSPESSLPIFDNIFVDMGDSQSISASLSTFAAHMKIVSDLQKRATQNSLILLDELGSSTDPDQGLSLAQALLENLISKKSLVIVSTHFSYLKYLGYTQEGAMNASLDIQEVTFLPTYRVRMGVPGESFAFALAKRQGLENSVLLRAENLYQSQATESRVFMEKLREREEELYQKVTLLEENLLEIAKEKKIFQEKEELLKEKEREVIEKEIYLENAFLREARQSLESLQQKLRESKNLEEDWKKAKSKIKGWEENVKKQEVFLTSLEESHVKSLDYEVGMMVRLKRQGSQALLLQREKKDKWSVQVGSFKMIVSQNDFERIERESKVPRKKTYYLKESIPFDKRALLSLDIRGYRLEEAKVAVLQQLSGALSEGMARFSIIHGMGNGVLKIGVHEVLGKYPHVSRFYLADANEGGSGKTWVELKMN